MLTIISLIIFWGVISVLGWQLTRFVIKENRIEVLLPFSLVIGCGIYSFLLNAVAYFIQIEISFYFVLALSLFFIYLLSRINKKQERPHWGINLKWRKILFATCLFIMISVGIMGIRTIGEIEHLNHLPLSSTIAGGNFPVRDVSDPNFYSPYHYGYNLFLAAGSKVSGFPLWFNYDLFSFFFIGVVFLLCFVLARDLCRNDFKAYAASLLVIFGGNLNFLYGLKGLAGIYQKYFLHHSVDAPFKFLNDMIFGTGVIRSGTPAILYAGTAWLTLGFALSIVIIYLYFRAIGDRTNYLRISLMGGILFSFLALSAEIFFGALAIVFFVYPMLYAIVKKDWQEGRFYFKISLLILLTGSLIACLQGGVVTHTVKQFFSDYHYPVSGNFFFSHGYLFRGLLLTINGWQNVSIPIFGRIFLMEWAWLMIFSIPSFLYILRRNLPAALFLILLIFTSFVIPLVINIGLFQGDFSRVSFLASFFGNLSIGLLLGWLLIFFRKKWQRMLMVILILCMVLQGLLYCFLCPLFPLLKTGQPFLAEPTEPSAAESQAISWIKENTNSGEYFLAFDDAIHASDYNSRFTIFTGRLAPSFFHGRDAKIPNYISNTEGIVLYEKILAECNNADLKNLGYRYLYVDEKFPNDLLQKCLADNNLELSFEAEDKGQFLRIYEIKD